MVHKSLVEAGANRQEHRFTLIAAIQERRME